MRSFSKTIAAFGVAAVAAIGVAGCSSTDADKPAVKASSSAPASATIPAPEGSPSTIPAEPLASTGEVETVSLLTGAKMTSRTLTVKVGDYILVPIPTPTDYEGGFAFVNGETKILDEKEKVSSGAVVEVQGLTAEEMRAAADKANGDLLQGSQGGAVAIYQAKEPVEAFPVEIAGLDKDKNVVDGAHVSYVFTVEK